MNILLVNPKTPPTFYSYTYSLKFINKAASPPLGLLTVASMLPEEWNMKLIDLNIHKLRDRDIKWADYIFLTGMNVHKKSFKKVIRQCNQLETKVVAGGPMATIEHENFPGVDHFILNEAEITLPPFLDDLKHGVPKHIYTSSEFPDLSSTPVPKWSLVNINDYATMNIQYSRGCPYDCEFCSIPFLNGRKHRTKNPRQFISELDSLRNQGWNGHVFIVDDNFIGNKRKLKTETLPLLDKWAEAHNYPFNFTTEASINLADDDELMNLMVKAGFKSVFVGIETPDEDSLAECGKFQNRGRDLTQAVKIMQRKGLQISGGFIVGFDHDTPSIFKRQIDFIQKSGIVTAMVGLLNAPKGTRLFKRLKTERRLLAEEYANNTGGSINFVPRMKYQKLIKGYKEILETIYSQKKYYERIRTFLKEYKPVVKTKNHISPSLVLGVFKSFWTLGVLEKGRRYFWKLLFYSLFKHPRAVPLVITMAANGFHFRKITASI